MTLNLTHHTPADYREIPWLDDALSTTELLRYPSETESKKPFLWQLSISSRLSSGEFGKFPGYVRHMLQISGKTITLRHIKHGDQKLAPLKFYSFNADWETKRNLVGKAEDFNLYVRSERHSATIDRIDLKDRKPLSKRLSRYTLLWVYQGSVEWECAGEKKVLNERDILSVDSTEELETILKSKRALCFQINITEKF